MDATKTIFLEYLGKAVKISDNNTADDASDRETPAEKEKAKLFSYAKKRGALALLYGTGVFGEEEAADVTKCCNSFYNLMYDSFQAMELLEKAGIEAAILKGIAMASLYPIPEYRPAADIDILLKKSSDVDEAVNVLENSGWKVDESKDVQHHIVITSPRKSELELHFKPFRVFESERLNNVVERVFSDDGPAYEDYKLFDCRVKTLNSSVTGFYILLHCLEHFMASGVGIKSLCDLAVFFSSKSGNTKESIECYRKLVDESGIKGFSDYCISLAYKYLGLDEKTADMLIFDAKISGVSSFIKNNSEELEDFLDDILESGCFGELEQGRLVNMGDSGISGLVKQVHYRMKENFPKVSRIVLLWPILWMSTIIVFIRNNKRVRGQKTVDYIKNAKKRSKIVKKMNLF